MIVIESLAWPGITNTGACSAAAFVLDRDHVAVLEVLRSAVAGAMCAAVSHVSFDIGFGSSCSQPLFAKRPS